ncbi:MAG: FAD-dependent oxidoreductase [Coriobacteriia bacterium]|nr:FAD-dependent oxidoreductase [Coriobacteriia bacterium]MCL2749699.1 FAD-dependent oxidoreductase [Coriobacteriia bacterium]
MSNDIIIIGGGPAGLSAAITARARNKKVLVISNHRQHSPLAAAHLVDNYPGMHSVSGMHLLDTMHTQAEKMGVEFLEARVLTILPLQDKYLVSTSGDALEAQSIIIACGAASGGKPFKGEAEYLGRGVSYCATCDGMLFRNSTVLIVGLSDEAAEEANFMAEIGATVHLVAKEIPADLDSRVQTYAGRLLSIEGDALGVTGVVISERPSEEEAASGAKPKEVQLEVNGVFVLRPGVAPTSMLPALETESGFIKVDATMHTNLSGVFAAGDCTGKPMQIAKAVGEGQIAVFSAVEYLTDKN